MVFSFVLASPGLSSVAGSSWNGWDFATCKGLLVIATAIAAEFWLRSPWIIVLLALSFGHERSGGVGARYYAAMILDTQASGVDALGENDSARKALERARSSLKAIEMRLVCRPCAETLCSRAAVSDMSSSSFVLAARRRARPEERGMS